MSDLPVTYFAKVINDCIEHEEGGWKLTSHPDDPDGGWTYGGVTRKTFEAHTGMLVPVERTTEFLSTTEGIKVFQDRVVNIYFNNFIRPLWDAGMIVDVPAFVMQSDRYQNEFNRTVFSCAVNRGVQSARDAWNSCNFKNTDTLVDRRMKFIAAWQDQYTKLVADNAKAWREYAIQLEAILAQKQINTDEEYKNLASMKPRTLRATFLQGWINRTQRFF